MSLYSPIKNGNWVTLRLWPINPGDVLKARPIGQVYDVEPLAFGLNFVWVRWMDGTQTKNSSAELFLIPDPPERIRESWNQVWVIDNGEQTFSDIQVVRYGSSVPYKLWGWLAPNGDLYPCAYWMHDRLEDKLLNELPLVKTKTLIAQGWIYIGVTDADTEVRPAQPQLDVMGLLLMAPMPTSLNSRLMGAQGNDLNGAIRHTASRHGLPVSGAV